MLEELLSEATECDYKVALEEKKPKSWLKSVSAYANGVGGDLIFGVDNDRNIIGLADAQTDSETISRLIRERITPYPRFILTPKRENGKDILILKVLPGRSTPYYYRADGVMEAYVRLGNDSVIAADHLLNELILKGMNRSYDSLTSAYQFKDYSFSKLRERYKSWTGNSMEDKHFDSFEIRDSDGKLTNAGALLADDSPIRQSRLFCTRWNGLDKSGGKVDALDSAEYSGSLIILLNEGVGFIRRNMKKMWKKTADSRIEMPEYCERSYFESLVNALIHRSYLILGSEVHVDMFDDRLVIYSPGGMPDGKPIQERDISTVSSERRNPVLADIFGRLGYMERQGSGLTKIRDAYEKEVNFRPGMEPVFFSDNTQFTVTLPNLNYHLVIDETGVSSEKQVYEDKKTGVSFEKQAFEDEKTGDSSNDQLFKAALNSLHFSKPTRENIQSLYQHFGTELTFARADITDVIGISSSPAGELIRKMREGGLIEAVTGQGKGKYRFIIK